MPHGHLPRDDADDLPRPAPDPEGAVGVDPEDAARHLALGPHDADVGGLAPMRREVQMSVICRGVLQRKYRLSDQSALSL